MTKGYARIAVAVSGLCLGILGGVWAQPAQEPIGEVTVVVGPVSILRGGSSLPGPVTMRQPVLVADTFEAGPSGRVQALFLDDTVLTAGPRSRMEITEYVYDPGPRIRRLTVTLTEGAVRALVGQAFPGLGSSFAIRIGGGSVFAESAYCVVWRRKGVTGVVNIGTGGSVSFIWEGRVVILGPGFYSLAAAGRPPLAALPLNAQAAPAVRQAIAETDVGDQMGATVDELAEKAIEEELPSCPPGSPPGGVCPREAPGAALSPATPPAVTSGAKQR